MTIARFSFPTPIAFGAGARKLVADHLREQGLKRPLIVTDRALAALPVMAEFKTHLTGLNVASFDVAQEFTVRNRQNIFLHRKIIIHQNERPNSQNQIQNIKFLNFWLLFWHTPLPRRKTLTEQT